MIEMGRGKLSRTSNFMIYLIIAASSVLYYKMAFVGSRSTLDNLNRSIASEEVELEKARTQLNSLASGSSAMAADKRYSKDLNEKYMSANKSLGEVIETLAKGVEESSFAVNKIATEKQESHDGYTRTLFNVDVESSFPAIGRFLEGLEHSPLLTDVRSVQISRINGDLQRCSTTIKLYSYVVNR
jgi:uncharacterized coiled-coil protein SlyX